MNNIDNEKHEDLIEILEQLIETIGIMKNNTEDYLLCQNEEEAKEWLVFLKEHVDKDELKTLENEIADRFFYKYDVQMLWSSIFVTLRPNFCHRVYATP